LSSLCWEARDAIQLYGEALLRPGARRDKLDSASCRSYVMASDADLNFAEVHE
jgi:hypothetical protein